MLNDPEPVQNEEDDSDSSDGAHAVVNNDRRQSQPVTDDVLTDEEGQVLKYDANKFKEKLGEFKEKLREFKEKLREFRNDREVRVTFKKNILSFMTYAVGIKLLYSSEIQEACRKLKEKNQNIGTSNTWTVHITPNNEYWIDFFANLRLYSRRVKRMYKKKEERKVQTWRYEYRNQTAEVIIECQEKAARCELVMGLGSYPNIYNSFDENIPFDFLPGLLTTENELVSVEAASLHFLLFGLEVMRSPSALIHHMMFVDLIKSRSNVNYKWETMFRDQKLPMSTEGAVKYSRRKHVWYNKFMPLEYWYDEYEGYETDDGYALRLVEKEQTLTKDWLKMKHGENILDELYEDGILNYGKVGEIFNLLENQCKTWYGFKVGHLPTQQELPIDQRLKESLRIS